MIKAIRFMLVIICVLYFSSGCKLSDQDLKLSAKQEGAVVNTFPQAYVFKLKDLKGEEVDLNKYIGKKKIVLVFWTTWCPYCRQALKYLQADFKSINDMGVELLAINIGESELKVNRFAQGYNFSFKILLDQYLSVTNHYELFGVPTYVVINKSGQVIYSGNSFEKNMLK